MGIVKLQQRTYDDDVKTKTKTKFKKRTFVSNNEKPSKVVKKVSRKIVAPATPNKLLDSEIEF